MWGKLEENHNLGKERQVYFDQINSGMPFRCQVSDSYTSQKLREQFGGQTCKFGSHQHMHVIYLPQGWEEKESYEVRNNLDKAVEISYIYSRKGRGRRTRGQMEKEDPSRGLTRNFQ